MEEQWARQGFALLDAEALFGPALLADAAGALEDAAAGPVSVFGRTLQPDPEQGAAFPFASGGPPDGAAPLNQLALHDALRRTAEGLLRVELGDVRLAHAGLVRHADELTADASLTLAPATAPDDALLALLPLQGGDSDGGGDGRLLVRRLDPLRRFPAASEAARALRFGRSELNDPPEELYARERAVRYTAVRPAGVWVAFFQECCTD